jgi:hypothetical protein
MPQMIIVADSDTVTTLIDAGPTCMTAHLL